MPSTRPARENSGSKDQYYFPPLDYWLMGMENDNVLLAKVNIRYPISLAISALLLGGCAPANQGGEQIVPDRQEACDEIDSYLKESGDTMARMADSIESDNPGSLSRYSGRLIEISDEIAVLDVGGGELSQAVQELAISLREIGSTAPLDDPAPLVAANDEFQISINRLGRLCDWPPLQG